MKKIFQIKTHSAAETKKFGKKFGGLLRAGDVVALEGELGAGKTTLVKGIAKGLGVQSERAVSSPTFVLIHEYQGREKIYHLDWYRLKSVKDADAELAEECFSSNAVALVEWPKRGKPLLPKQRIEIELSHDGGSSRKIKLRFIGKKYEDFSL